MKDEVSHLTEEIGVMHVVLKDGSRVPVKAKTVYTHWTSGRKDCDVQIEKPIATIAKND